MDSRFRGNDDLFRGSLVQPRLACPDQSRFAIGHVQEESRADDMDEAKASLMTHADIHPGNCGAFSLWPLGQAGLESCQDPTSQPDLRRVTEEIRVSDRI